MHYISCYVDIMIYLFNVEIDLSHGCPKVSMDKVFALIGFSPGIMLQYFLLCGHCDLYL